MWRLRLITDRIPFGVLEMKSGWVIDDPHRNRLLNNAVARSGLQMMVILDAQFCMFTAATSVLNRWRSSGAVVAAIPATPYPDERYRTKMLWWNRRDFFSYAQPDQVAKILAETKLLLHELYRRGRGRRHSSRMERDRSREANPHNTFRGCLTCRTLRV